MATLTVPKLALERHRIVRLESGANTMTPPVGHQVVEQLRSQVRHLQSELNEVAEARCWPPSRFSAIEHVISGAVLGACGAAVALLANVVLAPLAGEHPLELIRVYLTFPLGAEALALTEAAPHLPVLRDGMVLTFGCCLYLVTGMLLGIPFHAAMTRFVQPSLRNRLVVCTILSLLVWQVVFYFLLSWLQPLLFRGDWITNGEHLPWWVAGATHLIFGWTMALLAPIARYVPFRPRTPEAEEGPRLGPGG